MWALAWAPSFLLPRLANDAIFARRYYKESAMKWNTPKVTEVCIGMEINDYFPAEL
jgi:coenzyme PQQ precursor peptide PqqA